MEKVKRKVKTGINIIDILIVLIILAAAAVLLYVFVLSGRGEAVTPQTHTIRYVVELKGIRDEFADNVTIGENAVDSVAMYKIGTVVAYEEKEATYKGVNALKGESVISPVPGKMNMYVTIEAQAYLDKYIYSIDGYRIAVGSSVGLKLPNFIGIGYCIKLDVLD